MDKNSIISESYNTVIEEGFNSYLEEKATAENSEIKVDEEALIAVIEGKWLVTGLTELDGITPGEYINSLSTLDELMEFFICIANASDVGVPDILLERLRSFGKAASDRLFDFVKSSMGSQKRDINLVISQAVYAIGCLREEEYKQKLITLLIDTGKDDMISEAICAAIVEYGESILSDLIKAFDATDQQIVKEQLLVCVAEISSEKDYKSNEIFYFFKNAFRVVSNLILAVEILGDYGDGRAIPLLRGYILKNIREIDMTTFNHMVAVIKKLGGDIDDLAIQNRN